MKRWIRSSSLVLAFFLSLPTAITAAPPFTIDITVDDRRQSFFFSDVKVFYDLISEDHLEQKFSYKGISEVNAVSDFLGTEMNFRFPRAGNELVLEVPSLDITEEFKGDDRDDSVKKLKSFLDMKVIPYHSLPGSTITASEGVQMYAEAPSKFFGNWLTEEVMTTREVEHYVLSEFELEVYPSFPISGNQIWVKLRPKKNQSSGSKEASCRTDGECWAFVGWQSGSFESTGIVNIFLRNEFVHQAQ